MNDTVCAAEGPRSKRSKPKINGDEHTLRKISEAATDLAKDVDLATQRLRQETYRREKKKESVMVILQQRLDIRGQVKRIWPLLSEMDQATLREFGFQAPRDDRSL